MSQHIDLKQLERKAYTIYHQDGIVDIFLGLVIVIFALMLLTPMFEVTIPLMGGISVVWILSFTGAKRSITVPRIGYVEFKAHRRYRVTFLAVFLLIVNLAFFAIIASDILRNEFVFLFNQYGLFIVAVVIGGIFVLFGWVVQISRLYGYGGVTFVAFATAQVFLLHLALPVLVLGVVITVTGFLLLYRFLQKYPKSHPEGDTTNPWEEEALGLEVVINE
ncbi:MAG: hypothetical protein Q6361_06700 [Candidatus Hermodarchaeota archaeon]|nr:hypothetical protein [Candidatus Hermodarchaeota archaeon]MDO8123789.1 hypothetical protein [Candidatus Hermodarchaeota archaeon]